MDKGGITTPAPNVVPISFSTAEVIFLLKINLGEEESRAYWVR